jgi:hypothetical protein
MVVIWRNLIKKILSDRESTDELYEKLRNDFTKLLEDYNLSGNNKMARAYDDILHLVNLLDALTINTIEDRERTEKLIQSLLETQEEKDKIIQQLQEEVRNRESEIAEFRAKYGKQLGWIDKFFKRASETTPE